MKIVHVCVSCFYIDGYSYQENELVKHHVKQGHDVHVIASTENYVDSKLSYVKPGEYMGKDGAIVTRLPYSRMLPHIVMKKLRVIPQLLSKIEELSPSIIMFHGLCAWELRTVCSYVKNNPNVRLWVDSHEDSNNSARTFVSKFLHKAFYRPVIKSVISNINEVLCISYETIEFVSRMYEVPESKLKFFPLGSNIIPNDAYIFNRNKIRRSLKIREDEVLFIQSGKQTTRKKLLESLNAFVEANEKNFRFVIVGSIDSEIEKEAFAIIDRQKNIEFLGWKTSTQLTEILCGADVYLQPGTQSATMQMSMGARCALILDDVPSHKPYVKNNGWLINDRNSLRDIFMDIVALRGVLDNMMCESYEIAKDLMDYEKQAAYLVDGSVE
jgi:hypothetical protein